MNSEELELSLRTEFEGYLKKLRDDTRRDAAEFQSRIEDELAQQKTRLDEAFREFSARHDADPEFDEPFQASVAEHLRLARDEGARITANAMAEAERLDTPAPAAAPKYDLIKEAVDDISSNDSQSAILKSLVQHAGRFAPRGAFFIIKNEHFGGWKAFDSDGELTNTAIRDVHFPMSADSILGTAANSLSTAEGSASANQNNGAFLAPLEFGEPERMYAIPLVARGRGVAVLYADHGADGGGELNRDALETLVRVAGLTVELLAFSSQPARADEESDAAFAPAPAPEPPAIEEAPQNQSFDTPAYAMEPPAPQPEAFSFGEQPTSGYDAPTSSESSFAMPAPVETQGAEEYRAEPYIDRESYASPDVPPMAEPPVESSPFTTTPSFDPTVYASPEVPPMAEPTVESSPFTTTPSFDPGAFESKPAGFEDSTAGEMVFDSGGSIESAAVEQSPFERQAAEFEPAAAFGSTGFGQVPEPAVETSAPPPPTQARRSDRPVDLPIEVPEDERRIHNDARRFARLLVSEIKLYNEKKVTEGREAQDLYDRLREAIDRSREMYDKRVQPPVAAKFDYFHYELVNSLADGDSSRLGSGYPGSSV